MVMIGWSLVTAFCGFVESFSGFTACRLILGICESALFPALNLYVAMFWKREELAKRASFLFIAQALAGAFGGLLAYGLIHMNNVGGKEGWRWLYWVEGMLSFVIGIASYWLYPDNPETAYFLTEEERQLGRDRLIKYGNYEEYNSADIKAALTSPICWLSGIIQTCCDTYLYSKCSLCPKATLLQELRRNNFPRFFDIPSSHHQGNGILKLGGPIFNHSNLHYGCIGFLCSGLARGQAPAPRAYHAFVQPLHSSRLCSSAGQSHPRRRLFRMLLGHCFWLCLAGYQYYLDQWKYEPSL